MLGLLLIVLVAVAVVGQLEASHRTARADATIDAVIRQQSATFVSAAYVISYSFVIDGTTVHRSTMRKASQWAYDDRTGIVCYDPNDPNNQILLHPGESCAQAAGANEPAQT